MLNITLCILFYTTSKNHARRNYDSWEENENKKNQTKTNHKKTHPQNNKTK